MFLRENWPGPYLESCQDAGFFGIWGITPGTRHTAKALRFWVKGISHSDHPAHLTSGCETEKTDTCISVTTCKNTIIFPNMFRVTDPFQPCRQGTCRPAHCSWWWAGLQGWTAPPRPRCLRSWSCWWTPRCSCRSHQTSRRSLSAYALNVGCVPPLNPRSFQKRYLNRILQDSNCNNSPWFWCGLLLGENIHHQWKQHL